METVAAQYAGNYPLDPGEGKNYTVWRNVKDYGAIGDGKADDTAAINKAMSDGNRCGSNCNATSARGAVIYFPSGIYLVSSSIITYYNTQMIGNPVNLPVIRSSKYFVGLGVISTDKYLGGNAEWFIDTDNFFRAVRNFVVDIRNTTVGSPACIHWQVAQATSLENVFFYMNPDKARNQVGVFSENGSGGFMSDLTFTLGSIGLQSGGNQQFTTRAMQFINCTTAVALLWDWGWTFKSLNIFGSEYAITISGDTVGGSVYLLDSLIETTQTGIAMANTSHGAVTTGFLNLDNVVLQGVPTAVTQNNVSVLAGGTTKIKSWVYGKVYDGAHPNGTLSTGGALQNSHPMTPSLSGGPNQGYFERNRPQYEFVHADHFVNARKYASGDGVTDDTNGLNTAFSVAASGGLTLYIPAGTYMVTDTVQIPSGSVIVGECWPQIMARGTKFQDMANPHVMVRVGKKGGETGTVEIQDLLFTVQGPTAGAVLVEWNIQATAAGTAAMWGDHFRIGGALGTKLQVADCPTLKGVTNNKCIASSLMLHLTNTSSAYLENIWAWSADHDIDDPQQTDIDVYSARGILIESQGPSWLYATAAEHSMLYQYQLYQAQDIFMSMIQTENYYFAPAPNSPGPFNNSVGYYDSDPDIAGDCANQTDGCSQSWALNIVRSNNIQIGGAGLYSWYNQNYDQTQKCVDDQDCQLSLVSTQANTNVYINNIYTIGATQMIVPSDSNMSTVVAKDNTNQISHPFLSVVSAWTDINSDDLSAVSDLCINDPDIEDCIDQGTTIQICDPTLTFSSLDTLQAASSTIPNVCLDSYSLQVISDMLDEALNNYTSVDNGYDKVFKYYIEAVKGMIPYQISAFMEKGGPGNQFFDCVVREQHGKNETPVACPWLDGAEESWEVYYVPKNLSGFYDTLEATYGINQTWITLGDDTSQVQCTNDEGKNCGKLIQTYHGYPILANNIDVPNPKDIVTAALTNMTQIKLNIMATRMDISLGKWQGSNNDVVQAVSMPAFLIAQAIDSMQSAKSLGEATKKEDQTNLILEVLGVVFMFLPFIGEAGEWATGLAALGRALNLLSNLGNTALTAADVIKNPTDAPMAIMGALMGITGDVRNPKGFETMSDAKRAMKDGDLAKIGPVFKAKNDKLQSIVGGCAKK
ncbi:glycoside hydrolase family 55 protein [Stipitochalara longipes BDJ]|nr:glycoside hydrolase family 55 protein [Stipitochalara longipes BDJ]